MIQGRAPQDSTRILDPVWAETISFIPFSCFLTSVIYTGLIGESACLWAVLQDLTAI